MKIFFQLTILLIISVSCQGTELNSQGTTPPSHETWDQLLRKNVSPDGFVNYKGFIKDKNQVEAYLDLLSQNPPDKNTWSENEQLAYWINAYNAFTVKLIVDHYPVESIQDLHPTIKIPGINTVWHKKFFKIGGQEASLDQIEHKILRKDFEEPRIHFAINCASFSCPPLRNEAYNPDVLDRQLDEQARAFINDPERNQITQNKIKISKLFSWFKGDFTKGGSLIEFLNNYSKQPIASDADISHMDYDWSLNEKSGL